MPENFTEKVLEELNTKRLKRQVLISSREREMREICPELKALELRIARASLVDRQAVLALINERNIAVEVWLASYGKTADWLNPSVECQACEDTGFANGQLCACVRNEVARRMFSEAGLTSSSPTFDKFDLSLFPENKNISDGRTVREHMTFLRDVGLTYSDKFPDLQKPNMLFYGVNGRGKTFLLDCIAGRVISRGYWAIRATAFSVNDVMAKALFDRADPDSLFECDLLALDDLGSEPILNKVTINSFFSLLNERTVKGKPFIISTNLTPDEILRRYGDRIFSRITDARTVRVLEFEGIDLRRGL